MSQVTHTTSIVRVAFVGGAKGRWKIERLDQPALEGRRRLTASRLQQGHIALRHTERSSGPDLRPALSATGGL